MFSSITTKLSVCSDESTDLKDDEKPNPPAGSHIISTMTPPASSEESREPPTLGGIHTYNHRPNAGQSQGHRPAVTPERTKVEDEQEEEDNEEEEEGGGEAEEGEEEEEDGN